VLNVGRDEDCTKKYFCEAQENYSSRAKEEDILQMQAGLLEMQNSTDLEWVALQVWFCLKAFVQFLRETVAIFANSKGKTMPLNTQHSACQMKIQEY